MKNVIKTFRKSILLITIFGTMLSNATEISLSKDKGDLKKTALTLYNVKEGSLLSIKDYNGLVLYKELINQKGVYSKGFDLTVLPDGDYFFELEKDLQIKVIPFTVKSNTVEFNKKEEAVFFKPYVQQKEGKVYITKLAPNYEPLDIRVYKRTYSGHFELIHDEKIEGTQTIKRIYGLKKGASYKIIFNSNNRVFTELITN